jgi:hypothetical protein
MLALFWGNRSNAKSFDQNASSQSPFVSGTTQCCLEQTLVCEPIEEKLGETLFPHMKFPLIFTDYDKRKARHLRARRPEMSDDEIIAHVILDIRKEIDSGENRPLKERTEKKSVTRSKKLKKSKSHRKKKRSVRLIFTGGFETNRRRH